MKFGITAASCLNRHQLTRSLNILTLNGLKEWHS